MALVLILFLVGVWLGALQIQTRKRAHELDRKNRLLLFVHNNLEKRVEERTAELRVAQEQQKQFFSEVSHALQTPLTVLKGELEVMKRTTPASVDYGAFDRSIDNISRLTYNLLTLSRLESIKEDFKKESVNLSCLVKGVVEYFEVLAQDKGITVFSSIEPGMQVCGDPVRLEEMLTNLLSNAIKYLLNSEKRISVELSKEGVNARILITDTGIGIEKEDLPHLFEKFYRSRNAHEVAKGTGLGLAICKKIIEIHNGTITVDSELGKGTVFTIRIPLVQGEQQNNALP